VWQLDKWGQLVRPKSRSSRRTIPLRPEVVDVVVAWRRQQAVWEDRLGEEWGNDHDLVFTTNTGGPVWTRNVSRAFSRALDQAHVTHGSLKTLRSTVATQLAEAGVHPKKAQAFLGHADMSTTMKYYTAAGELDDLADYQDQAWLEPGHHWPTTDQVDDVRLITIADDAERLSLCRSKVYELIAEQKLPTVKIGRARRVSMDDLRAFVAEHRAA